MRILISGICGFAGSSIGEALLDGDLSLELLGFDNLSRPGSYHNLPRLRQRGIKVFHADARSVTDLEVLPPVEWIIDAAANPSVLAGVDGAVSSRQLMEHNVIGTINLLELAKRHRAGFILLSTSRVYSLRALSEIPLIVSNQAFALDARLSWPDGLTAQGVTEDFATTLPRSLYGTSKLASELIALEYGEAFDLPVWINRCGVLAGAGQFGRPDQGIIAYWINAWLRRQPLRYIGFEGLGYQTRDCLHPRDLVTVLQKQMTTTEAGQPRLLNFGGGIENSISLAQLSEWCATRFGNHKVTGDKTPRSFDIPWLVMDSSKAEQVWSWQPGTKLESILDEVASHAASHPDWLSLSGALES